MSSCRRKCDQIVITGVAEQTVGVLKQALEKNPTAKEALVANLPSWTSASVQGVGVKAQMVSVEVAILVPPSLHHTNMWLLPMVVRIISQRFQAVEF